jgi:hypothetical protein
MVDGGVRRTVSDYTSSLSRRQKRIVLFDACRKKSEGLNCRLLPH